MDQAHRETDERLENMEKHLKAIYSRAGRELEKKAEAYWADFDRLDQKKRKLLAAGRITQEEYSTWRRNKILYAQRFPQLKKQLAESMLHANETALRYINDQLPDIYALNYNALQPDVEGLGGYSFTLVDPTTVKNLASKDLQLLPYKEIDPDKDIPWNMKHIQAKVLQGILQGDNIPRIASRLRTVAAMNQVAAVRNARTMVTGAECRGRQDSYVQAQKDGIQIQREWISTNDGRTRHAHRLLQGATAEVDKPFDSELGPIMFPGDPEAAPANVYNCRCTIAAKILGFAKKAGAAAKQGVEKTVETVEKAKAFVSEKLKKAMGEEDFEKFAKMVQDSKAAKMFQAFSDKLKGIHKAAGGCYYSPSLDSVYFNYDKEKRGLARYGTLAHEMGHSFDARIFDALHMKAIEADIINEKCKIGTGFRPTLEKGVSTSDRWLAALRRDKKALAKYKVDADYTSKIANDLVPNGTVTSGVQDAFDGLFSTQDHFDEGWLPWGHGDKYYNRFYNGKIKGFGLDKDLKQVYKDLGFDASNQAKVKAISREYETASELWANINSAYTLNGKELEYMRKYFPESCKEYEKITEEFKNVV